MISDDCAEAIPSANISVISGAINLRLGLGGLRASCRQHQMTDWVIPKGEELPKPVKTYSMTPGTAGFYDVGELHSIDMPATLRFLRITATDIDVLPCKYFDEVDTRKSIAENLA